MAEVSRISEETRTKVVLKGYLSPEQRKELRDFVKRERGDKLISINFYPDEREKETVILLSPCIYEIFQCENTDGRMLNHKATFAFSADALRDVLLKDDIGQNIFIEKEWVPFRKEILEKSVILLGFVRKDSVITFDLLSTNQACEKSDGRRKTDCVKSITTKRQNADMRKAKDFLLNRFAEHIKEVEPETNPTAYAMDILSSAIAGKLMEMLD